MGGNTKKPLDIKPEHLKRIANIFQDSDDDDHSPSSPAIDDFKLGFSKGVNNVKNDSAVKVQDKRFNPPTITVKNTGGAGSMK